MTQDHDFDREAAHEHFSVECFNRTWDLLNKETRTDEEDEELIRLSFASHWHWTQREDCTSKTVSVAYWQTSRVYAVLGQAENAKRYAERCLTVSQDAWLDPFYLGYGYEALARAESVAGDRDASKRHLETARQLADEVVDPEAKQWLLDDLATIKPPA